MANLIKIKMRNKIKKKRIYLNQHKQLQINR